MAPLPDPQSHTVNAIYAMHAAKPREERDYLGLSILGEECERKLWYGFRWVHAPEEFTGRKMRLFDTGHREEARLLDELRAIGVDVWEVDPDTGHQWGVEAAEGHARGHLDAVLLGVPEAPKTAHVFEAKTHSAKSFKALVKDGVQKAKPVHYAQMQGYMHLMSLTRALYLAVEKDTDEIYSERIDYDHEFGLRLIAKAARIVRSDAPPTRLHPDPTNKLAFPCGYCPAFGVCHGGQWARTNCRTCLSSTPISGGKWFCDRHQKEIPLADQKNGCPAHLFLPSLVPGEQFDADPHGHTVSYRLPSGETWIDGEGKANG